MGVLRLTAGIIAALVLLAGWTAHAQPTQYEPLPAGTYAVTQPQPGSPDPAIERTYSLTVPRRYDPAVPTPLLIVLHGQTGSGERTRAYTGFDVLADAETVLIAYPDGVGGSWNDGRPGADDLLSDDDAFIIDMIARIGRIAHVDADRVYVAGISAGGMMAYRLACTQPDLLAGIAVVASTLPVYVADACPADAPALPIVLFHGTDDPILPWTGIRETFLSAEATFAYWTERNGCTGLRRLTDQPDADPADGTRVVLTSATGCSAPVALYAVLFGGHTWPGRTIPAIGLGRTAMDIDATAAIWQFLAQHARSSPPA